MNFRQFKSLRNKISNALLDHIHLLEHLQDLCLENSSDEELALLTSNFESIGHELIHVHTELLLATKISFESVQIREKPKFDNYVFESGILSPEIDEVLEKYSETGEY